MKDVVIQPTLRMHRNTQPIDQPKGTARFILNGSPKSHESDLTRVTNILSTEQCDFPEDLFIIGAKYTTDNQFIICAVSKDNSNSQIGLLDKNCKYVPTVVDECLNFEYCSLVDIEYKIYQGCETVMYFTDGINPLRYFNFSRPNNFKDSEGNWDCEKFRLQRKTKAPCITELNIVTGVGEAKPGLYYVSIQYLDENLNAGNFFYTKGPVKISSIIDVAIAAIEVKTSDLNPDFPFYRLAVTPVNTMTGVQGNSLVSPRIPTSQGTYIFDISSSDNTTEVIENIRLRDADIDRADHLMQVDNQLLVANTKSTQIDISGFQKFASKISTQYAVKLVDKDDTNNRAHPSNPNYLEFGSEMGDEVQSIGIVYCDAEGNEFGPFHVPGRCPDFFSFDDILEEDSKCIKVIGNVTTSGQTPSSNQTDYRARILVSWKEDGVLITRTLNINFFQAESYEKILTCTDKEISEPKIEVDITGEAIVDYSFDIEIINQSSTTTSIPTVLPLGKWDTEVLTTYHPDMTPLITEEKFNDTIQTLLNLSGLSSTSIEFINYVYDQVINKVVYLPQRWEYQNTAFRDSRLMAYYECKNSTYLPPINSDCIMDYWGIDACGNSLQNAPIRHHRFPCRAIEPIEQNTSDLSVLGFEFDNIEYPEGIVGHFFVKGIKSNNDYLIRDKGYLGKLRGCEENSQGNNIKGFGYYDGFPEGDSEFQDNDFYYMSVGSSLNKANISDGLYIKHIGEFNTTKTLLNKSGGYNEASTDWGGDDLELMNRFWRLGGFNPNTYNMTYDKHENLGATQDKLIDNDYYLYNASWAQRMNFFLGTNRSQANSISYVSIKQNKDIHCDLDNIQYKRLSKCTSQSSNEEVYGGDVYLQAPYLPNFLFSDFNKNNTDILIAAVISAVGVLLAPLTFGGSLAVTAAAVTVLVGITALGIASIIESIKEGYIDCIVKDIEIEGSDGGGFVGDGFVLFGSELLYGGYIESYYDYTELLIDFQETCYNPYIEDQNLIFSTDAIYASYVPWIENKLLYFHDETSNDRRLLNPPCGIIYLSNADFNPLAYPGIFYVPIPTTYNYCSDCLEVFPNRVYKSEQSFQEELTDNYRVFLPNNYTDIPSEHGSITNIFRKNNAIWIQTEESTYVLPQNIQERITDEIVSFIGTGEYFSIPPRMLVDSDNGSAGSVDKWATVKTPFGIFFVDRRTSKVYLVQGDNKLEELSDPKYGFDKFFDRELDIKLNTCDSYLRAGYDYETEQVFLTKVDYKALQKYVYSDGKYYNANNEQIYLSDPQYFCFCGWTLSWSFNNTGWFSFHSYTPFNYLSAKSGLLSSSNTGKLLKHNSIGSYQTFDGVHYPFIVEFVNQENHINTNIVNHVQLHTIAKEYNEELNDYLDVRYVTFNKAWLYNDRQLSGEIELIYRDKENEQSYVDNKSNFQYITRTERNWYLNEFRDMINNYSEPMFNRNCVDMRLSDKYINTNALDMNKEWYNMERFRDKYLIVRLIFDKFDNVQLTLNYAIPNESPVTRF